MIIVGRERITQNNTYYYQSIMQHCFLFAMSRSRQKLLTYICVNIMHATDDYLNTRQEIMPTKRHEDGIISPRLCSLDRYPLRTRCQKSCLYIQPGAIKLRHSSDTSWTFWQSSCSLPLATWLLVDKILLIVSRLYHTATLLQLLTPSVFPQRATKTTTFQTRQRKTNIPQKNLQT